jgi:hypothetical protein
LHPIIHCIYSSAAAPTFKEHEIPSLLEGTRNANAARDVTGMLLYVDGSFFQVLEGEAAIVEPLYEKIKRDPRHSRVTLIIKEPILERSFGEWTMGFAALDAKEAGDLAGTNDFFDGASCLAKMTTGRAKKLLSAFRGGRWRVERTGTHRVHGRIA